MNTTPAARHHLTGDQLTAALTEFRQIIAAHYATGYHSVIAYVPSTAMWIVLDHNEEIATTADPAEAARVYNAIQPRT